MAEKPEEKARKAIEDLLILGGWLVQDVMEANVTAGRGVAIREYPLKSGHGFADYLLYIDGVAAGVVEAKKEGETLTGYEVQTEKYSVGLPDSLKAYRRPLPFCYQSTGGETRFTNLLEPDARSRQVFAFHKPETLADWLMEESRSPGSTLRARLKHLPPLTGEGLWPAQERAIGGLECSLAEGRPRALIQMASGGGKTFTACNFSYRLVKHAKGRRILFLVDRNTLGKQTYKEFQQFATPDDGRKFTELYNVQHMQSNKLDPVSKVCITTIQRLYSMLKGEEEFDPAQEEGPLSNLEALMKEPVPVTYNPALPIETFDFIITDECHRSIYNLWRQVLEYFDAFIIGLTATPSKQTFGFFNQNLVMEYNHDQAVADGVNVDFDVYRKVGDSLNAKPSETYDIVMTNPPFGKKSSVTVINEEGEQSKESLVVVRDDFWASTSNKQLNFLQHVKSLLNIHARAAIVVPDNVLFEGGAGETVRRKLLHECDVHTLLRLPTGIFYAQGVKANVLFFDRKPASETPWTKTLWIYDFRTNQHFTLKTNPLKRSDLDDFVACYNPENRHERKPTERFKPFEYDELLKRDKVSLDISWLKDESLEDSADLPDPDVIAAEIAEDLEAALDQFSQIMSDLKA